MSFFIASCAIFGVYVVKSKMVEDHVPPVIKCEEDTFSVSVNADPSELLTGVTAKDNRDGDITKSVRISTMSHFKGEGKRTITYAVFDKANNAATLERTLTYTDYHAPRVYLSEPLRCTVNELKKINFADNMKAEDCLDGDITNQIHTTWSDGLYSYSAGTHQMTVQVSNGAGDTCLLPLEVVVTDTDSKEGSKYYPVLKEYILYTSVGKELNLSDYVLGIKQGATEYLFADTTQGLSVKASDVNIKSQVNYSAPGVYPVDYTYTSKDGVTAVTKLFVVVEE